MGLDSSSLGRLTLGRQSVWLSNGTLIQHSTNFINTHVPYWNGAQGRLTSGITRQSNVVQYTTPSFAGVNASLSYSPDTGAGGAAGSNGFVNAESLQAVASTNARLYGATLRGAWGPIGVQYDYAVKRTVSGLTNLVTSSELLNGTTVASVGAATGSFNVRPKNVDHKLLLGWTYRPGGQIVLAATRLQAYDWNAITTDDLSQYSYGVVWEHVMGNFQFLGQYGRTTKVSGCSGFATGRSGIRTQTVCDDSRSQSYTAAVRYLMSKRTSVYVSYNKIHNERNQWADYTGASYTSGPITASNARGGDPRVIGVGILHNF